MSPRPTNTLPATQGQPNQPLARRLINCVCVHLAELYFSILQRKVLTPNDLYSLTDLIERIHAFGARYSALGKLFSWTFTRQELERCLRDPLLQTQPPTSLHHAA
jgi:hypothetical protein